MPPSNSDWFKPSDETGQHWHDDAPRPAEARAVPRDGDSLYRRSIGDTWRGPVRGMPEQREETTPAAAVPTAARDVPAGQSWAFPTHRTAAAAVPVEPLSLEHFTLALRRLSALRLGEMLQARVWGDARQPALGEHYHRFRSNPPHYLLTAEDAVRRRIWQLIAAQGSALAPPVFDCPNWLGEALGCGDGAGCDCARRGTLPVRWRLPNPDGGRAA